MNEAAAENRSSLRRAVYGMIGKRKETKGNAILSCPVGGDYYKNLPEGISRLFPAYG